MVMIQDRRTVRKALLNGPWFSALWYMISVWREQARIARMRRRTRIALEGLSDEQLKDIGLGRGETGYDMLRETFEHPARAMVTFGKAET